MKTTYSFVATILAAGLMASCTSPYPVESGGTAMRTSGAYTASHRGAGSTYHSRDLRDPSGDWRHDDLDEDGPDDSSDARRSHYIDNGRYTSARVWNRSSRGPAALPTGARRVQIGSQVYYTHGSTWYRPTATGFVTVANPY